MCDTVGSHFKLVVEFVDVKIYKKIAIKNNKMSLKLSDQELMELQIS